ncbi:hypothetical protein SNEBB_008242 [Seison nebaliae]|nr:hypothetical protein SNEBB_008242 [Seison nebaliae]
MELGDTRESQFTICRKKVFHFNFYPIISIRDDSFSLSLNETISLLPYSQNTLVRQIRKLREEIIQINQIHL